MPEFVQNGLLTPEGDRVRAFIEGQFAEADRKNDTTALNSMGGYLSHYYVNVYKMRTMTAAQWLEDFSATGASHAYAAMQHMEEAAVKAEEVEAKTDGIAGQLDALRESLTAEITKLKAANTKLRNQVKALREAEEADTDEGEVEADTENEPESGEVVDAPDVDGGEADTEDGTGEEEADAPQEA